MGSCITLEVKRTPLHHAVIYNNIKAASRLIEMGQMKIYERDSNGETAVDFCRRIGSPEMKKIFGIEI
jgi:ankyrin repeat protein